MALRKVSRAMKTSGSKIAFRRMVQRAEQVLCATPLSEQEYQRLLSLPIYKELIYSKYNIKSKSKSKSSSLTTSLKELKELKSKSKNSKSRERERVIERERDFPLTTSSSQTTLWRGR